MAESVLIESRTFKKVLKLIEEEKVLISSHGYDELAEDGILVKEIIESAASGIVIEDYPDFGKGPCCLVLQKDFKGKPIHAVWGIASGSDEPAVLITAYRPSSERWCDDFRRRRDAK